MQKLYLPDEIKKYVINMNCEENKIGCSEARVYKFYSDTKAFYLKVESKPGELENEYKSFSWLRDKLPVPEIISWFSDSEYDYLLLSEIKGKTLCDISYLHDPKTAVSALANGIRLLHTIDIKHCPLYNGLDKKLSDASENIKQRRVNMDDWEHSSNGFSSSESLLDYLINNKPPTEELIFTHGDYCHENIFGNDKDIIGFIDLGRAGAADKWQDIALCLRSLWHNFQTKKYDSLLLEQIGVPLDKEKLDYYILLDELF